MCESRGFSDNILTVLFALAWIVMIGYIAKELFIVGTFKNTNKDE